MEYDVIVIGLGPTGATAANLLASHGLRTLVVERETRIDPRPRAIAIDEDALRVWQGLGLLEPLLAGMRTAVTLHLKHRGRVFLTCQLKGRGLQGLPGTCFFHQPLLEQTLRDGLSGRAAVRTGCELISIDQDAGGVCAGLRQLRDGSREQVHARFLLGCDGGSSTTRKLLGIGLPGCSLAEPWIDIQARAPAAPDPGGRISFSFHADPQRPGAECLFAMGLHRWEFQLRPGEDPAAAGTPEGIGRLLASRGVDAGTLEIMQSWVYRFHIRQAGQWQRGRAFLCGDAAHLMPPFAGQGVSSGVRDAANLCWKIAAFLHGAAPASLLLSYETERRPHVAAVTRFSRRVGALVRVRNPALAAGRDAACRIAVRLPWLGRRIRDFHIKPQWISGPGWFAPARRLAPRLHSPAGQLLWQPWVVTRCGRRQRLDDLLGSGWSYLSWCHAGIPAALAGQHIRLLRVHPCTTPWHRLADGAVGELAMVDIEDRLRLQFRRHRARGLLIRPDRFIYGSDRDDLAGCLGIAADQRTRRLDAPSTACTAC